MWYCKNNLKKRGINFINSKYVYYDKFCVIVFVRYSGLKIWLLVFFFGK